MEYTEAIDGQISLLLRQRGHVTPAMLAGVDEADGALLLSRYVEVHSSEAALVFDGQRLTPAPSAPAARPATPAPVPGSAVERLSPVDQVLAAPQGKSLLDVKPSGGRYPKWAWVIVLGFGILGGIVAWFVVKDSNPRAARQMLVTGLIVQIVSTLAGLLLLKG